MYNTPYRRSSYTSTGHLLHRLVLGWRNLPDFKIAKTSVNKRLLLCCNASLQGLLCKLTRPHTLGVIHYGCKGTTIFWIVQIIATKKLLFAV